MAFRFPLATLLRFRQTQERQQEILMQEANFQAAELRRSIAGVDRSAAEMAKNDAVELQAGILAAALQFNLLRHSILIEHRRVLELALVQAEEACTLRRQALQQAHQQREVVETLRQHQLENYQEEQKRQEQRRLDDLFLLRREYLRRS